MTQDRPTPETDAASKFGLAGGFDSEWWTPRILARRLERERDEAREQLHERIAKLTAALRRAEQAEALLREALTKRTDAPGFVRWFSEWTERIRAHLKESERGL